MIHIKEGLCSHYEEVREYFVGKEKCFSSSPEGIFLILNQGIPDWMNTWSHMRPIKIARLPKTKIQTTFAPDTIRSQMTSILAGMVINSLVETVSC